MKNENSPRDRSTDLGVVRINNDVIAAIASITAMGVKGVAKLGGGLGRTLYELLTKRPCVKGVKVRATNGGDIHLAIHIIVDYGVDIPRAADEVQQNVKHAVEKMTGLVLSEVNVVVEGVAGKSVNRNP